MAPRIATRERPYHHGDLRRVVVETAQAMLREEKGWQFTLREVARRAGVSHTAPYRHFPDKSALLAELAAVGFEELGAAVSLVTARSFRSLRAEFLAVARAYVAFGASNPSLYRLMFSADLERRAHPRLHQAGLAAFGALVEILRRGQQLGAFRKRPVRDQAAACWALVHGFTILMLDGQLLPEKVGARPLEGVLTSMLEGLAPGS